MNRTAVVAGAVAVAAALLGGGGTARADAYDAMLTRAIAAKERALDVSEPARWEEALRLFQETDAIRSTRESKYEVGFAAERLHREDLATDAYEAAIELGLAGSAASKARAFVAGHASSMARLEVHGPAGARIRIAGADRGRLPLARAIVLFPGNVRVDVVHPDGRDDTRSIDLSAGGRAVLDLARPAPGEATPPVAAAATGAANTAAPPPAEPPLPVAPGPPPATNDRYLLSPAPGPPPPPPERPGNDRTLGWVLLGTGVAVAVVGTALIPISFGRISSERAALADSCDTLDGQDDCAHVKLGRMVEAQSHVDSIVTWKAVRIGAFVGAGVGLVTAALGGWWAAHGDAPAPPGAPPPSAARAPWWLPQASVSGGGTTVTLTWLSRY